MATISWSTDLIEDLNSKMLCSLSPEMLVEFCRMSLETIRNGTPNKKIYARAAEQLKIDVSMISSSISALADIFLVGAKQDLSVSNFTLSLTDIPSSVPSPDAVKINLNQTVIKSLAEYYINNVREIRKILSDLSMGLPHYKNLDWRIDVQLASRSLRHDATPSFLLELQTCGPNIILTSNEGKEIQKQKETTQIHCLQSDYANLKHICSELEKALEQSKSVYARRLLRHVKH